MLTEKLVFSVRYPKDYLLETSYSYELNPQEEINGIKFLIPSSLATGTNLSSFDTGLAIEHIFDVEDCSADLFFNNKVKEQTITDNEIDYSFASSTSVAVGNIYEEDVWAIKGTSPCLAIRYFIHSTNINNYPQSTIKEFDRDSLIKQFDEIRHSLIIR